MRIGSFQTNTSSQFRFIITTILILKVFIATTATATTNAAAEAAAATNIYLFSSPGRGEQIIPHVKSRAAGTHFLNTARSLLNDKARESARWAVDIALAANLSRVDRKECKKLKIQLKNIRSKALTFFKQPQKNRPVSIWLAQLASLLQMGEHTKAQTLIVLAISKWIKEWESMQDTVIKTHATDKVYKQLGTLARQGVWLAQTAALACDTPKQVFVVADSLSEGFNRLEEVIEMGEDMQLPLQLAVAQAWDRNGNFTRAAKTFPLHMIKSILKGEKLPMQTNIDVDGSSTIPFDGRNPLYNEVMKLIPIWHAYPRWCRFNKVRKEYGLKLKKKVLPTQKAVKAGWWYNKKGSRVSIGDQQQNSDNAIMVPQHVLRVDATQLTARSFVEKYVSISQPVILTHLRDYMLHDIDGSYTSSTSSFWTKRNILKQFGKHLVSVSNSSLVLPLQSFARNVDGSHFLRDTMEMKEFVEKHMLGRSASRKKDPLYLFGPTALSDVVLKNINIPHLFKVGIFDRDTKLRTRDMLMTLGGAGSGIWLHAHSTAWNALLFGRRQWWMLPPGKYTGPRFGSIDAFHNSKKWKGLKKNALTFIQQEGEVVFVPNGWIHGTKNLSPVVGVASELGHARNGMDAVVRDLWKDLNSFD